MASRILVAGIGNDFLRDDGFGPAVARALLQRPQRENVIVRDIGTGSAKLVYDLMSGCDVLLLIDAAKRGGEPGSLYLIEPDAAQSPGATLDPHSADVRALFAQMSALKLWPPIVRVLGCEPADVESLEMGLSEVVTRAVQPAVTWIELLLEQFADAEYSPS